MSSLRQYESIQYRQKAKENRKQKQITLLLIEPENQFRKKSAIMVIDSIILILKSKTSSLPTTRSVLQQDF